MTVEKLKPILPYAGIPFICGAFLLIGAREADMFTILKLELIIIIGYIAAIHDMKTKQVPNSLVLSMLAVWIVIMTPKIFLDTDNAAAMLIDSALGFAIGGGLFLLVYLISGKGLGGGDVKFMAAAGAYLGFGGTIPAVLYGSILAALTGLTLILLKKIGRKGTIPLIPFLYIGILMTVFLK